MSLRAGAWVEVLSREEILATLDADGRLDGLPLMPEMFAYCGKRFQVWKRAHKTCDTVNRTGGRKLIEAVHLQELRCDGQAHGGCQAACLLFWKEAWLRRVDGPVCKTARSSGCSEQDVYRATRAPGDTDDASPTYSCQATRLPEATTLLPWWDIRQYVEDITSGNVKMVDMLGGAVYVGYHALVMKTRNRAPWLSSALVTLYDRLQNARAGVPFPRKPGQVPAGTPTPSRPLGLRPGELVQIRTHKEILRTLDSNNKNRGMFFDAEEVPYCGKTYRVRSTVERIINERTGKMIALKDKNVILEGVICKGHYSDRRMHCPRAIYSIWRETWLERPEQAGSSEVVSARSTP